MHALTPALVGRAGSARRAGSVCACCSALRSHCSTWPPSRCRPPSCPLQAAARGQTGARAGSTPPAGTLSLSLSLSLSLTLTLTLILTLTLTLTLSLSLSLSLSLTLTLPRQLNGTCARLGSVPADGASGLVCWLGLDGGLPVRVLWVDLVALGLCTLRCAARRAVPDAPMGGPRLAWAERWLLRVGHVAALLLCFALSSLAALQQASGLLWMGYLLLSLLVLVRGTWRATRPRRRRQASHHPHHPHHPHRPHHSHHSHHSHLGAGGWRRRRWRWEAAVRGGAAWRAVHRYAWAVPLLVVAYQAPLVPDACVQPVGTEAEGEGRVTWCALWMATLGLAQLRTPTAAAAAATEGVAAFSLLPFALIWLVMDVQVLLHSASYRSSYYTILYYSPWLYLLYY
jgi:hypothetical protein